MSPRPMDLYLTLVFACAQATQARTFCAETKLPLEMGEWRHGLQHMDSAVVENKPVAISEGQVYVYENYFPNHTIKYVYVDNLAIKTCGASASIKAGGVGTESVLIVLHADANQEIRSVVDIWGVKKPVKLPKRTEEIPKTLKSLYLYKNWRAVNHNGAYIVL